MTDAQNHSRWVPLAVAALLVLATAPTGGLPSAATGASVALLLLAAGTSALAIRRRPSISIPRPTVLGVVSGVLAVPAALSLANRILPGSLAGLVAFAVVLPISTALVVAAPFARGPNDGRTRLITVGFVVVCSGLSALALGPFGRHIDVYEFLTRGVDALLHGANPYATVYPNIYTPQESLGFYGSGAVVGDHLAYGFPYLPGTLFGAIPGYLLGDVRLSGVVLLGLLAVLIVLTTADLRGRLVAATLVTAPAIMTVVTGSWTEPLQLALIGFAVVALKRRNLLVAAVLLGFTLATKQYLVVALPAFWLLRGVFARRDWLILLGSAVAVTLPFLLANPREFWRAVVEWQLIQPFRSDSVSLLALSVNQFGWPPAAVYGVLPIAVGLAVALLLAWRLNPGPSAFLLTTALALLATVLLSKQAFVNYYMFVGGCLLLAAWVAGDRDPLLRARSLSGEVAEVGDVRRESGIHTQPQGEVDRGEVGERHVPGQPLERVARIGGVLADPNARVPGGAGDGVR